MKPLATMKVIDLTHALAGPFCTYQLGLLGAEVIKVEPPRGGDDFREMLPDAFDAVNAGKKSLTLDLRNDEGQSILDRLLRDADIVIENYKASTARKLNLGWERFAAVNDQLVYCAIRGFASNGPLADMPAVEWSVQAQMGLSALYLDDRDDPRDLGVGMLDVSSGANAVSAILAALLERQRTRRGGMVEVTMADAALMLAATHIDPQLSGRRKGRAVQRAAVGRFRARDRRLLVMAANRRWFDALCEVIGAPLDEDPRFATADARQANADALLAAIEAALASRDAAEWEALLLARGVPAAVVRYLPESVIAGGTTKPGNLLDVISKASGRTLTVFGSAIGGAADPDRQPAVPMLGGDSDDVLAALGLDAEAIERLRAAGTV